MYNFNEQKILKEFFENPTRKFHILELARITSLHPNTVLTSLNSLTKEKLVKQEKKTHIKEAYANPENKEFVLKKRLFNLEQVYNSKIIEFLIKLYAPEAISIIGSYSQGEDIEKSDIDLVIITKKKEDANLEKFEKVLKRKIHLITTDYKEMSNEFYINLINGILLYGYLEKK
mgnify:FL=1